MRVGYLATFQNPGRELTDHEVYQAELRQAKLAEPLGFDIIWTVEHHFSGYQMNPDTMQFLTYMAGATEKIELGASCVVLPWHNPVRVVENVIALDHYTNGRVKLGIARGAGKDEFAGYKVDMNLTRPIFVEYAEMVLEGLETGVCEYDGEHLQQPRVEIRPEPYQSFKGRTYCGAVSPESLEIMAKLGVGMLITPNKPWDVVAAEMKDYRAAFKKYHGAEPVPTLANGWVFCDEDEGRARELGSKYIKAYWNTVLDHYKFNKPKVFEGVKGYEHYAEGAKLQEQMEADELAESFLDFHVYGTPEQCYDKIMNIRSHIGCEGFTGCFRYAGMPYDEAERNMRLFARDVLPELKKVPAPTGFGAIEDDAPQQAAG